MPMTRALLLSLALLLSTAFAHDAVVFSSAKTLTPGQPSVGGLLASATPSSPLVLLVTPHFTLAQFSKAAALYTSQESSSAVVKAAKAASSALSQYIDDLYVPDATTITNISMFNAGQSVYIVSASTFSALDDLSSAILQAVGRTATVVVTSEEALMDDEVVRVKRDDDVDASGNLTFPIVLPTLPDDATTPPSMPCLFYMEGINVIARIDGDYHTAYVRDDGTGDSKWSGGADCPDTTAGAEKADVLQTFNISIVPGGDMGDDNVIDPLSFSLTIRSDTLGYWQLDNVELLEPLSVSYKNSKGTFQATASPGAILQQDSISYVNMLSVFGYAWNCWDTQAVFWTADDGTNSIGISLHGVQIQVYAKGGNTADTYANIPFFVSKVESCTGTFSASSWMGLIVALILISILLFGYLMVQSVQTGDRFDDPKARQIVINVRE